ncbi:MAG: CoA transferase, partial [Gammaproteobacteria bacterium]|nr:CoA transferase [Gammaproteobacteria bacterium]
QILGDLGADVIQIESPGGAHGRHLAPFRDGVQDKEHSLFWWAYSRGKRSIELDIDADPETFLRLVEHCDFLIEAEAPASLSARGFGYADLASRNPGLIQVSMTPYGSEGPKANWPASDITLVASAGPMALTGDEDRPPLRVTVPQAWHHAAAEAAAAALVALHERHRSGSGQHVEVSAQQAMTFATQGNILSAAVNESTAQRIAGGVKVGDLRIQLTYPAKDGHVSITHVFGATIGPATRRLMEYVCDEGFCDTTTRDKDWIGYGLLLATGEEPVAEFERVKQCVAACTASKTKAELLEAAMERRLLLAPMSTIEDVALSPQLAAREYFTEPEGDGQSATVAHPGPFAKFGATPLQLRLRPPRIGEHTQEVLAELEKHQPTRHTPTGADPSLPLAGVKILDFMWALAGPGATRILADWGATVIRVESSTKLCVGRTIRPFIDGDESPEKSAVFHSTNAGKRMITLNLNSPDGRAVALDLARWADVVTESFSPRAMKSFELDYKTLKGVNPDVIMLSTCLMGQTGPLAMFAGYGNLAAAIAGFYSITGWEDREPAGPFGAYTDYIAPRYNAVAVLAALDHRRRTGQGQHIDLAQAEAALHFIAPALLDYTANGHLQGRRGNRDLNWAPHGAFPVAGDDRYIAIACETNEQWQALCAQVPSLEATAEFSQASQRLARQDELEAIICGYTREQDGYQLEEQLQAAGIPASMVQNSPELLEDPQLNHLGHFVRLPHHEGGDTVIEGPRIHMSRSQPVMETSAPTFSRDMMFVLNDVLGYDDEKLGELLVSGALE